LLFYIKFYDKIKKIFSLINMTSNVIKSGCMVSIFFDDERIIKKESYGLIGLVKLWNQN